MKCFTASLTNGGPVVNVAKWRRGVGCSKRLVPSPHLSGLYFFVPTIREKSSRNNNFILGRTQYSVQITKRLTILDTKLDFKSLETYLTLLQVRENI